MQQICLWHSFIIQTELFPTGSRGHFPLCSSPPFINLSAAEPLWLLGAFPFRARRATLSCLVIVKLSASRSQRRVAGAAVAAVQGWTMIVLLSCAPFRLGLGIYMYLKWINVYGIRYTRSSNFLWLMRFISKALSNFYVPFSIVGFLLMKIVLVLCGP